jgi:hypothetical protein
MLSARRLRRASLLVGGLLAVCAATALAAGNSVHVRVPSDARKNVHYRIKLHGHAAGQKVLYIFVNDLKPCASTPAKDRKRANGFRWAVQGDYAESVLGLTHHTGQVYACAYLAQYIGKQIPDSSVAHRFTTFTVH